MEVRPGFGHNSAYRERSSGAFGGGTSISPLLQGLTMLRDIEAFHLLLLGDPERHEDTDQLEQGVGHAGRPDQGHGDAVELDQNLLGMALEQSGGSADRGGGKHAAEESAGQAADAVDAEYVERVVISEAVLQPGAGPIADAARNGADDDAVPGRDKAGGGRDGAEAGDGARDHAEHRGLLPRPPFDAAPDQ